MKKAREEGKAQLLRVFRKAQKDRSQLLVISCEDEILQSWKTEGNDDFGFPTIGTLVDDDRGGGVSPFLEHCAVIAGRDHNLDGWVCENGNGANVVTPLERLHQRTLDLLPEFHHVEDSQPLDGIVSGFRRDGLVLRLAFVVLQDSIPKGILEVRITDIGLRLGGIELALECGCEG